MFIALGSAIGTGLFMGSGRAISLAGPSVIFVYMLIGAVIFLVLRAMGEILLSNLRYKSFSDFTTDLVGPMAGSVVARPASLDPGARRHRRSADPEPGVREELRRNRILVLHD